jgi:hypothetical protein
MTTGGNCKSAIFKLRFKNVLCYMCEHCSASDIVCPVTVCAGETGYVKLARTREKYTDAEHRCKVHKRLWPHKREET